MNTKFILPIITLAICCFKWNHINAQCPVRTAHIVMINSSGVAMTYVLTDVFNNVLSAGSTNSGNSAMAFDVCVEYGCYNIAFSGLSSSSPFDVFTVSVDGINMESGITNSTQSFCFNAGCKETTACNYCGPCEFEDNTSCQDGACADPLACNFNPAWPCSRPELCIYPGCTDPLASNYNPVACAGGVCEYNGTLHVEVTNSTAGIFGSDVLIHFTIIDETFTTIVAEDIEAGQTEAYDYFLEAGCYQIVFTGVDISDSWQVSWNGGTLLSDSFFAADNGAFPFCAGMGCTNPVACNYDSLAMLDDGSCAPASEVLVSTFRPQAATAATYFIEDENGEVVVGADNILNALIPLNVPSGNEGDGYCLGYGCFTAILNGFSCGDVFNVSFQGHELLNVNGQNGEFIFCIGEGCTNPSACNFDPNATVNDGSCVFGLAGCTDNAACNFNPAADCENGSCVYCGEAVSLSMFDGGNGILNGATYSVEDADGNIFLEGTSTSVDEWYENFCLSEGCYKFTIVPVGNGNPVAWQISGPTVFGGTQSGSSTEFLFSIGVQCGCANPSACNYDSNAVLENGTCLPAGCTNILSCNYNPNVACDDGSCVAGVNAQLTILQSQFNSVDAITYVVSAPNGSVAATGILQATLLTTVQFCIPVGCYELSLFGLLTNNDPLLADHFTFTLSGLPVQTGTASGVYPFCITPGCTFPSACNYDVNANVFDDTCLYGTSGCTDPLACNYDSSATCDDGSCEGGTEVVIRVTNATSSPATINYTFSDLGVPIHAGSFTAQAGQQTQSFCAPNTCFQFSISGMGSGDSYQIGTTINGVFVAFNGFGGGTTNTTTSFCNTYGCTDNGACNFNGAAMDDGSCLFNCTVCSTLELYDSGDEVLTGTRINIYDSYMQLLQSQLSYQIDEDYIGICTEEFGCYFLEIISSGTPGSPITWQMNVDGNLFSGTGPGLYGFSPSGTLGCTEENAANYDSDASCDNGSCIFLGCTDSNACNFDPNANQDDGSCQPGFTVTLHVNNDSSSPANITYGYSNEQGFLLGTGSIPVGISDVNLCLPFGCNTFSITQLGSGDSYYIALVGMNIPLAEGVTSNPLISLCLSDEGCTDSNACNYNPLAFAEDFSCNYGGCTNPESCNYDPAALCDNGTCPVEEYILFVSNSYVVSGIGSNVTYSIINESGTALYSGSVAPVGGPNQLIQTIYMGQGCYDIVLNGISENDYVSLLYQGYTVFTNYTGGGFNPGGVTNGTLPFCNGRGCMFATACNYNPAALCDDGSCSNESLLYLDAFDQAGEQAFTIYDENQNVVVSQNESDNFLHEPFCLADGCYTIETVNMIMTSGPFLLLTMRTIDLGSIPLEYLGGQLVSVCIERGCNYSGACNYSPTATVYDGSCTIGGCTDITSCNYDPSATCDDGSCVEEWPAKLKFFHTFGLPIGIINYSIADENDVVVEEGTLPAQEYEFLTSVNFCFSPGCYTITITGLYDDGGNPGGDFWHLLVNDTYILIKGENGSFPFCVFNGCHDYYSCNYNADVVEDDGSCAYAGCTDPLSCNYDPAPLCENGVCGYYNATIHIDNSNEISYPADFILYNSTGGVQYHRLVIPGEVADDILCLDEECYTAILSNQAQGATWQIISEQNILIATGSSLETEVAFCVNPGCTDPLVCNYDPNVNADDGSCDYSSPALVLTIHNVGNDSNIEVEIVDEEGSNILQAMAFSAAGDYIYPFCGLLSCNNLFSTNGMNAGDFVTVSYNGEIIHTFAFNGFGYFCVIAGCTNPAFCNYEPDANIDDGSCCNSADCLTLQMVDGGDEILYGTTFHIYDEANNEVVARTSFSVDEWFAGFCSSPGCYTLVIDDNGPGIPVQWELVGLPYSFSGVGAGTFPFSVGTATNIHGCTNPLSCNYNLNAVCDDGSCLVSGCTLSSSCNYNPLATCNDGSCNGELLIEITVINQPDFNAFGNSTNNPGYSLIKNGLFSDTYVDCFPGSCLFNNGGAPLGISVIPVCTTYGCFILDPVAMGPNDQITVSIGTDYTFTITGSNNSAFFCFTIGCTNPLSCNYSPNADEDNGSCTTGGPGCTNPAACNYDSAASCDDLSCIMPGCTDPLACNFNPFTTCDDGSCVADLVATLHLHNVQNPSITYTVYDSNVNLYFNGFSPANQINTDVSTCMPFGCYTISISGLGGADSWELRVGGAIVTSGTTDGVFNFCFQDGCNNTSACNFNPAAIHDDGSCTFLQGDFDGNAVVNTSDLLLFMSGFGCSTNCAPFDLDGNGVTNTSDLLLFMSFFGSSC